MQFSLFAGFSLDALKFEGKNIEPTIWNNRFSICRSGAYRRTKLNINGG